ncbi:hypothetical protein DPMN_008877 [Dreissena polymorpha]|uniref:Uncharacterized protein n=1 Tax=Dreissena polymorpha TaxID=45954 RepID=A0A9D4MZK5_DREPO|nr:hypothetical protein DPMN_008877 [Dreissena polymorpha]
MGRTIVSGPDEFEPSGFDCCRDTRTYYPRTKFCSWLEQLCPYKIAELWQYANGYRLSLPKLAARNKKTVLICMDTMSYVV